MALFPSCGRGLGALRGEPLAQEQLTFQKEKCVTQHFSLGKPHDASSAPWSPIPSLHRPHHSYLPSDRCALFVAAAKPHSGSRANDADREASSRALLATTGMHGFEAPFVRPSPPVLRPMPGELMWLHLDIPHQLLWDSMMCADTSRISAVRCDIRAGVRSNRQRLEALLPPRRRLRRSARAPLQLNERWAGCVVGMWAERRSRAR